MKIWIHKAGGRGSWKYYFRPTWLNPVTWEKGKKKIYRWLFWGFNF